MKVGVRPPPRSRPVDGARGASPAEALRVDATRVAASPPPLPPRTAAAPTPASAKPVVVDTARVKAAWTESSKALATSALEAAAGKTGADAVTAVVDHILASRELKGASLSCAVSLGGKLAVERGTADAVNPCSNAKLVTAAYALAVLGPLHRFSTDVLRAPGGALVVKGGFDPTLTMDDLVAMARGLKARGVVKIPGIILDNTALAGGNVPRAFAKYGDEDWEYLARPEALSIHKNALKIVVRPGTSAGAPATVDVDSSAFRIESTVATVAAGSKFKLGCDEVDTAGVLERDADGKAIIRVWGEVAADYARGKQLVMKSPAPTEGFTDRLLTALAQAGIEVQGAVVEQATPPGSTPVIAHKSQPLGEILKTSLAVSNAFDHEMFALAASSKQRGGATSLDDAARSMERFLHDVTGGECVMVNASGIGNENRLRARDVVTLLENCAREPRLATLVQALAAPGEKGTLKTRMLDTEAEGVFRGKTGTGEGAVALSGVMASRRGDIVMSLLVDKTAAGRESARAALDAMAMALSALARA